MDARMSDFAEEAAKNFSVLGHRTDGGDIHVEDTLFGIKLVAMTCGLCGHMFTYDSDTCKILGGSNDRPFVSQTCTKTVPRS